MTNPKGSTQAMGVRKNDSGCCHMDETRGDNQHLDGIMHYTIFDDLAFLGLLGHWACCFRNSELYYDLLLITCRLPGVLNIWNGEYRLAALQDPPPSLTSSDASYNTHNPLNPLKPLIGKSVPPHHIRRSNLRNLLIGSSYRRIPWRTRLMMCVSTKKKLQAPAPDAIGNQLTNMEDEHSTISNIGISSRAF